MVDFNDPISVLSVVVPIVGGIIAGTYYVNKMIQDRKDRKPIFGRFQRIGYNDGSWVIFLHSPSRPVYKCNVTFRGKPITLNHSTNYEKSMALGEGGAFILPSNTLEGDEGVIIIRDGKTKIIKEKFNKIPKQE